MSQASSSGGAPTWRVTGQQPVSGQDARGQYVPGVRVLFQLSTGESGEVFVPNADFNPERVRVAVQAAARTLLGVSNLSGQL